MEDGNNDNNGGKVTSLGKAWAIYGGLMMLLVLFIYLNSSMFAFVYLAGCFIMPRMVFRTMVGWHPVNHTIQNEFTAKLSMFFLWPIVGFILLFKLTVNHLL